MKAVWTLALSVVLLAGCGTSPVGTKVNSPSMSQASGLFFKESDYKLISVDEINRFVSDDAANKANEGKKFKASGKLLSVIDSEFLNRDVSLTLTDGQHSAYLHREGFMSRSSAEAFVQKMGSGLEGESTVYFTLKSGDAIKRVHLDAVKRPDGGLVKL